MNFAERVINKKRCLLELLFFSFFFFLFFFPRKSIVMGPLMSHNTMSALPFLLYIQNFFPFWWASGFPLQRLFSIQACHSKAMFSLFVNIFDFDMLLHILHICLYISHGLHFSATENLMTDFCTIPDHSVWFVIILNILKANIFDTKQFQTMQSLNSSN